MDAYDQHFEGRLVCEESHICLCGVKKILYEGLCVECFKIRWMEAIDTHYKTIICHVCARVEQSTPGNRRYDTRPGVCGNAKRPICAKCVMEDVVVGCGFLV